MITNQQNGAMQEDERSYVPPILFRTHSFNVIRTDEMITVEGDDRGYLSESEQYFLAMPKLPIEDFADEEFAQEEEKVAPNLQHALNTLNADEFNATLSENPTYEYAARLDLCRQAAQITNEAQAKIYCDFIAQANLGSASLTLIISTPNVRAQVKAELIRKLLQADALQLQVLDGIFCYKQQIRNIRDAELKKSLQNRLTAAIDQPLAGSPLAYVFLNMQTDIDFLVAIIKRYTQEFTAEQNTGQYPAVIQHQRDNAGKNFLHHLLAVEDERLYAVINALEIMFCINNPALAKTACHFASAIFQKDNTGISPLAMLATRACQYLGQIAGGDTKAYEFYSVWSQIRNLLSDATYQLFSSYAALLPSACEEILRPLYDAFNNNAADNEILHLLHAGAYAQLERLVETRRTLRGEFTRPFFAQEDPTKRKKSTPKWSKEHKKIICNIFSVNEYLDVHDDDGMMLLLRIWEKLRGPEATNADLMALSKSAGLFHAMRICPVIKSDAWLNLCSVLNRSDANEQEIALHLERLATQIKYYQQDVHDIENHNSVLFATVEAHNNLQVVKFICLNLEVAIFPEILLLASCHNKFVTSGVFEFLCTRYPQQINAGPATLIDIRDGHGYDLFYCISRIAQSMQGFTYLLSLGLKPTNIYVKRENLLMKLVQVVMLHEIDTNFGMECIRILLSDQSLSRRWCSERNHAGYTALGLLMCTMSCIRKEVVIEMINLLIDAGTPLMEPFPDGASLLHLGVLTLHLGALRACLESLQKRLSPQDFDKVLNAKQCSQTTPLDVVVKMQQDPKGYAAAKKTEFLSEIDARITLLQEFGGKRNNPNSVVKVSKAPMPGFM